MVNLCLRTPNILKRERKWPQSLQTSWFFLSGLWHHWNHHPKIPADIAPFDGEIVPADPPWSYATPNTGAASGSWYVRGMFLCRISGSFQVWSASYTYIYYILIYLLDSCRTMQKLIVVGWIARQQGKSKDSQMAMSVTRKYVLPFAEIWVLSHLKQQ